MGYNCRMGQKEKVAEGMEYSADMLLKRIENIVHELAELRQAVLMQARPKERNLADQLYGALGQGSWEEYDLDLDWHRFSS